MTTHRMAAVDAQFYWMSAKIPSDHFMLYGFDGEPVNMDHAVDEVLGRVRACPELMMRVDDGCALTYPAWVSTEPGRVLTHELADDTWRGCLDAVVRLSAGEQLDIRRMPWRLHVFSAVRDIPGSTGAGTVVVVRFGHAFADGTRASALAAWLFGRTARVPEVARRSRDCLPWRAVDSVRTHRRLVDDTRAGRLAPGVGTRPALVTNARPVGARALRTLVRHRAQLPGPTVTVAVLAAVSTALSRHLGESARSLAAEVPISKPGVPLARNHFRTITVGLYPELARDALAERITAELAAGRRRAEHPAALSADRAFAAVPAPLLRWGVAQLDTDARPSLVGGNTVVSSVRCGAADLHFGGAPVVLTAGYPTLSPLMGLTHGVHGIGERVVISVHAAQSAVGDIDDYVQRLDAAL